MSLASIPEWIISHAKSTTCRQVALRATPEASLCAFTFQVSGHDPCQCHMGTVRQDLQNTCKVLAETDALLIIRAGEDAQSRCKHFTSVSPDRSGHFPPTVGAPMLGKSPLAYMVSSKQALTGELWIR